jgi:hypothetical protein
VFFARIFIICNKLVQLKACKDFYDSLLCIRGVMMSILMKFYSVVRNSDILFEVKIIKNNWGVFVLVGQKGKTQRTIFFSVKTIFPFFFVGLRMCKKKEN